MTFRLPSWYPPPDDNGNPVVMQLPIVDRRLIDSSNGSTSDLLADIIVDSYSPSISNFIKSSRRNYALGITPIHERSLELPGLGIRHQVHHGRETVTLTPKPGQVNLLADLNFDGYVAWVHVGANSWPKKSWPSYNLYINGYLIFNDITPDDTKTSAYFVMFGDTALRCQSLNDNGNPFQAGILEPGNTQPTKLVNQVLPKRKQVPATSSPTYGLPVSAHDDLLGYFLFGWDNQFDPTNFDNDGNQSTNHQYIQGQWTKLHPLPVLLQGLQFSSSTNSVLKVSAANNVTIHVTKNISTMGYQGPGDFLIAEFYDRKQLRAVSQSWHDEQTTGQAIIVNDHPLYWGAGIDFEGAADVGLDFDLTPQKSYSGLSVPPATLGVYDSNTSSTLVPSTDPTYQAELRAYETAYAAWDAELTTLEAAVTAAQNTYINDWNNVYNLCYLIKQDTPNGFVTTGSMGPNSTNVVNACVAAHAAMTAAEGGDSSQLATFASETAAIATPYAALLEDTSQEGNFYHATLLANQTSANNLNGEAATLSAAISAVLSYTPTAPTPPNVTGQYRGQDPSAFRQRQITVGASGWAFGDWTPK